MSKNSFTICKRYKELSEDNTIYSFIGNVSEEKVNELLVNFEMSLDKNVLRKTTKKRLFNILIEITQNLRNYLAISGDANQEYIFILLKSFENSYKIITGNSLLIKEIPGIKSRIDLVNCMSYQEIKELYRGVLDFGGVSKKGGAGLGFIDLAKRSGKKLKYKFEQIDEEYSFFTLEVDVLK